MGTKLFGNRSNITIEGIELPISDFKLILAQSELQQTGSFPLLYTEMRLDIAQGYESEFDNLLLVFGQNVNIELHTEQLDIMARLVVRGMGSNPTRLILGIE